MALSSLSVVGNASRRYHPAPLPPAGQVPAEPQVETPGGDDAAGVSAAGSRHGAVAGAGAAGSGGAHGSCHRP